MLSGKPGRQPDRRLLRPDRRPRGPGGAVERDPGRGRARAVRAGDGQLCPRRRRRRRRAPRGRQAGSRLGNDGRRNQRPQLLLGRDGVTLEHAVLAHHVRAHPRQRRRVDVQRDRRVLARVAHAVDVSGGEVKALRPPKNHDRVSVRRSRGAPRARALRRRRRRPRRRRGRESRCRGRPSSRSATR